jgi:hypothetical protein
MFDAKNLSAGDRVSFFDGALVLTVEDAGDWGIGWEESNFRTEWHEEWWKHAELLEPDIEPPTLPKLGNCEVFKRFENDYAFFNYQLHLFQQIKPRDLMEWFRECQSKLFDAGYFQAEVETRGDQ